MSQMQGLFNTSESINAIYHIRIKKGDHMTFSLEAEQSFHKFNTQSL